MKNIMKKIKEYDNILAIAQKKDINSYDSYAKLLEASLGQNEAMQGYLNKCKQEGYKFKKAIKKLEKFMVTNNE